MHSMQAGYMDKAQKYTEKALMQIEKLKSEKSLIELPPLGIYSLMVDFISNAGVFFISVLDSHPLLSSFQLMLLEHIIMCRLITGHKSLVIQEVHISFHIGPFFMNVTRSITSNCYPFNF